MEELLSQHRKEIKALDGEKRAAVKKAKATKGKKAKDEIVRYVAVYVVNDMSVLLYMLTASNMFIIITLIIQFIYVIYLFVRHSDE